MKHLVLGTALLLACALPLRLEAQATLPAIDPPPRSGDCSLTVKVPANTDPDSIVITLNSVTAPLKFTVMQRVPLVAVLKQPLLVNDEVTVKVGNSSTTARVVAVPAGSAPVASCGDAKTPPATFDEREVFEVSGFLGEVFDNFAPNINGGYVNPATATDIHSRLTAGIDSQYRLIGVPNSQRQLWIAASVLHGMRTADASCADTTTNADCLQQESAHPGASFNYILGHASTIEARVDARYELFTIQGDSDVPSRFYVYGRAGFLDLENAPTLYDARSVGVGLIAPKGIFRNSYAQVGWGDSKQYQTDRRFDRFKINGVLVFDVLPGLSADSFLGKLGAGSRFFLAISIDRNFRDGPDAVQTYIGADFDVRRIFGSF